MPECWPRGQRYLCRPRLFRNDLKQYTAEAFVSLVVLALTANLERRWSRRGLVVLAVTVVAGKLLAHTVVFVGTAVFVSLTLVAVAERQWPRVGESVAAGVSSAVGVAAIYLLFDRRSDTADLKTYWGASFPPTNRGWPGFRDFFVDHYQQLEPYLGLGKVWLAGSVVLAGIVTLALARRRAVALAVPVLLVEMLVAGVAKRYPLLDLRTSHFLLVTLAVVGAIGVAGVAALAARVSFVASLAIAALASALYLNHSEPYLRGHTSISPSDVPSQVRYIEQQRRPGDVIVLNRGAGYGFGYYWRRDNPQFTANSTALQGWSVTYPASSNIVVARKGGYRAISATMQRARRMAREGSGRIKTEHAVRHLGRRARGHDHDHGAVGSKGADRGALLRRVDLPGRARRVLLWQRADSDRRRRGRARDGARLQL